MLRNGCGKPISKSSMAEVCWDFCFFQGLLPWRKRFLPVLQGNLDEWHQTSSWSSWWPILFGRNQFRSLLQYSKVVRFSNNDTGLCEVVDKNSFQTMLQLSLLHFVDAPAGRCSVDADWQVFFTLDFRSEEWSFRRISGTDQEVVGFVEMVFVCSNPIILKMRLLALQVWKWAWLNSCVLHDDTWLLLSLVLQIPFQEVFRP